MIPVTVALASTALPARPASNRYRPERNVTTTATPAAAMNTVCTSPASIRPAVVDGATAVTTTALAPAYVP
jgi:hypothetical protein